LTALAGRGLLRVCDRGEAGKGATACAYHTLPLPPPAPRSIVERDVIDSVNILQVGAKGDSLPPACSRLARPRLTPWQPGATPSSPNRASRKPAPAARPRPLTPAPPARPPTPPQATMLAMEQAVRDLPVRPDYILIVRPGVGRGWGAGHSSALGGRICCCCQRPLSPPQVSLSALLPPRARRQDGNRVPKGLQRGQDEDDDEEEAADEEGAGSAAGGVAASRQGSAAPPGAAEAQAAPAPAGGGQQSSGGGSGGGRWPQAEAVVKGDATVMCIAAASVIAKVTRDREMERLDAEYPLFGFGRHKVGGVGLLRAEGA
jgi:hypothetical protein